MATIIRPLTPAEVNAARGLPAQIRGAATPAVQPGQFVFVAYFDGSRNDRDNVPDGELPTNVGQMANQTTRVATAANPTSSEYYPGPGSAGTITGSEYSPDAEMARTARLAYNDMREQVTNWLAANPGYDITQFPITTAIAGFSRGALTGILFARILNDEGLYIDGREVIAPGQQCVAALAVIEPVRGAAVEDIRIPPNVNPDNVLQLFALGERRSWFHAVDFQDPRVRLISVDADHSGTGSATPNSAGSLVLEGLTGFMQIVGVGIGEVPAERRYDPSSPLYLHLQETVETFAGTITYPLDPIGPRGLTTLPQRIASGSGDWLPINGLDLPPPTEPAAGNTPHIGASNPSDPSTWPTVQLYGATCYVAPSGLLVRPLEGSLVEIRDPLTLCGTVLGPLVGGARVPVARLAPGDGVVDAVDGGTVRVNTDPSVTGSRAIDSGASVGLQISSTQESQDAAGNLVSTQTVTTNSGALISTTTATTAPNSDTRTIVNTNSLGITTSTVVQTLDESRQHVLTTATTTTTDTTITTVTVNAQGTLLSSEHIEYNLNGGYTRMTEDGQGNINVSHHAANGDEIVVTTGTSLTTASATAPPNYSALSAAGGTITTGMALFRAIESGDTSAMLRGLGNWYGSLDAFARTQPGYTPGSFVGAEGISMLMGLDGIISSLRAGDTLGAVRGIIQVGDQVFGQAIAGTTQLTTPFSDAVGNALGISPASVIPILNLLIALRSGDPVSIVAGVCSFLAFSNPAAFGALGPIGVWLAVINAIYNLVSVTEPEATMACRRGADNLPVTFFSNKDDGGERLVENLYPGLIGSLIAQTKEPGSNMGLVPELLPQLHAVMWDGDPQVAYAIISRDPSNPQYEQRIYVERLSSLVNGQIVEENDRDYLSRVVELWTQQAQAEGGITSRAVTYGSVAISRRRFRYLINSEKQHPTITTAFLSRLNSKTGRRRAALQRPTQRQVSRVV